MDYYIIFDDEINDETVLSLIEECSEKIDAGHHIRLYFTSMGGETASGEILRDFLESNMDDITIIPQKLLFSLAADLVFLMLPDEMIESFDRIEIAMFHLPDRPIERFRVGEGGVNKIIYEVDKQYNEERIERIYSKIMSPKDLKKYKRGEDVHYYGASLLELAEKTKVFRDTPQASD